MPVDPADHSGSPVVCEDVHGQTGQHQLDRRQTTGHDRILNCTICCRGTPISVWHCACTRGASELLSKISSHCRDMVEWPRDQFRGAWRHIGSRLVVKPRIKLHCAMPTAVEKLKSVLYPRSYGILNLALPGLFPCLRPPGGIGPPAFRANGGNKRDDPPF